MVQRRIGQSYHILFCSAEVLEAVRNAKVLGFTPLHGGSVARGAGVEPLVGARRRCGGCAAHIFAEGVVLVRTAPTRDISQHRMVVTVPALAMIVAANSVTDTQHIRAAGCEHGYIKSHCHQNIHTVPTHALDVFVLQIGDR